MDIINQLANLVDTAAANATPIQQLSQEHQFSEAEAYAIQAASINQRYARGEQLIGLKMGFTSKAKMEQMGVHDMIWGRLTDAMLYPNNGQLPFERFIHPRAEPELCFKVEKDIDHQLSREELTEYITGVAPALEIIDSRYQNFKFSLEDVIADNCSSAGLVVGEWQSPTLPIDNLHIEMRFDDEVVQSGNSNAILGDPWESVIAASRLASHYGQLIPAGSYLMAGAATSAMYLKAGIKVTASVENLGSVSLEVI